jgi:hypothetical protein
MRIDEPIVHQDAGIGMSRNRTRLAMFALPSTIEDPKSCLPICRPQEGIVICIPEDLGSVRDVCIIRRKSQITDLQL